MGFIYKYDRIHAGVDILVNAKGFYDACIGVQIVPFNNALISAGFSLLNKSPALALRIKHFRIAYINDHQWLTQETRKPKAAILNEQLYSGLVWDLH